MHAPKQWLTKLSFPVVEKVSPRKAGKWGANLWHTPAPYHMTRREQTLIEVAGKRRVPFKESAYQSSLSSYYTIYSWGKGPLVLLVHGWGGSGSQMAGLAQPLAQAGYQVLAFDALAHGDASGKKTDLMEMTDVIKDLDAKCNGFHAIIAHSMGAIAAAVAVHDGVRAQRLVTCAAAASLDYYIKRFTRQIRASNRTIGRIVFNMNNRFKRNINELSLIHLAPKLGVPALIVHDEHDDQVDHREAIALSKCWPGSRVLLTKHLGHTSLLHDAKTIRKVVDFIAARRETSKHTRVSVSDTQK
jgi:pimeloyl-ACP methyl ester carboxylesterase